VAVLSGGADAKIAALIVEAIAVDVVDKLSGSSTHDLSMHEVTAMFAVSGRAPIGIAVLKNGPIVFG
jgi:hypothetical protein